MNDDRFNELHFLPPGVAPPAADPDSVENHWTVSQQAVDSRDLSGQGGHSTVTLRTPLFLDQAPWIGIPCTWADTVATTAAAMGITVSALHRDLSDVDGEADFFRPLGDPEDSETGDIEYLPRILPYYVDRFGLIPADFDGASVIDVRLCPYQNHLRRFAYSPDQIQRWERTEPDKPLAGGGYVGAATFPADIASTDQAATKFEQLRRLSPGAIVMASLLPYQLRQDIRAIVKSAPDGIILRIDQPEFSPFQVASMVSYAKRKLQQLGHPDMSLWVVPGQITPTDAAKLIGLGASAIAIDHWMKPLFEQLHRSSRGLTPEPLAEHHLPSMVHRLLTEPVEAALAGISNLGTAEIQGVRLATFHPKWAKACSAELLT
ncbi:MAG: hypothetical protein CBB71_12160 [Rhodopirellula sp. TMED11]|nr:MAG: hypothetical protein CBB71_12160 [Rhodopirellula sp. TMED11]